MKVNSTTLPDAAKYGLFDISDWGPWCDVTLTLKQALQSNTVKKLFLEEHQSKRAFRHLMNVLNREVYGSAF